MKKIFPDYSEITKDTLIQEIIWTDQISGRKVKTAFLENGIIKEEQYSNYKKAFSKYPVDGLYQYKYDNSEFPYERFYTNPKGDSLKVLYKYKDGQLIKREYWENERRSKMRKDAPEYGDGKPAGCIVAEEDLIRYRKWIKDEFYRYKFKNDQIDRVDIDYFRGGSPDRIINKYDEGKLISRTEYDKRRKTMNWQEVYEYRGSKIIKTKTYYITYWGEIPPTEKWIIILDAQRREIKIERTLEGNKDKETIIKSYNASGNLEQLTLTLNDSTKIFDYLLTYK